MPGLMDLGSFALIRIMARFENGPGYPQAKKTRNFLG